MAEQAVANLRHVSLSNTAIQVLYDNCLYLANKCDLQVFNYSGCIVVTLGYVLIPTESQFHPILSHSDIDYNWITDDELANIFPTAGSATAITNASHHLIASL